MRMYWKIYFYVLAFGYAVLTISAMRGEIRSSEAIDLLFDYAAFIGLYGFVFRVRLGPRWLWKVFVVVFLAWSNAYYIWFQDWDAVRAYSTGVMLAGFVFAIFSGIPRTIALILYGWRAEAPGRAAGSDSEGAGVPT